MPVFASVFGMRSLEALEKYGCQAYKIASFEANHHELIDAVIDTGKSIVISTGLLNDVEVQALYKKFVSNVNRNVDYLFMHCVSKYPTALEDASLFRISRFQRVYGADRVGYSDHTTGFLAPGLAVALGAKVVEKHFFNPKYGQSEDAKFSLNPGAFKRMVTHARKMYGACVEKKPEGFQEGMQFKRSLYVVKDIKEGECFTDKNISCIRPSYGLEPNLLKNTLKSKAKRDIAAGTALRGDLIEWK
jgi:pseudaminic acid synthase